MLESSKEYISLLEIFRKIYKDLPDESIQEFVDSLITQITHLNNLLDILSEKELKIKESNTNKTIH